MAMWGKLGGGRHRARGVVGWFLGLGCALLCNSAMAGPYLIGWSVNDYGGDGGNNLRYSNENTAGFLTGMALGNAAWNPASPYENLWVYRDSNVIDWAFCDPDLGALGFGDLWDSPNAAIAYYSGHGSNLIKDDSYCQSASDCNAPLLGTTLPGVCLQAPFKRYCLYTQPHYTELNLDFARTGPRSGRGRRTGRRVPDRCPARLPRTISA